MTNDKIPSKRRGADRSATLPVLFKWHRRLGLAAAVGVMLSSLSGILHPVMTRMQPEPAKLVLAQRVPPLAGAMPPSRVLADNGIAEINDLRVVGWAGKSYYQVTPPGAAQRRYFAVTDGAPLADGDRQYAEYLAREFVGETAARIRDARWVESFDWEYPRINRLLPVWRIEFDRADGLRAYVDTRTGRLGTIVDRVKAFSSVEFAILHRWQWLDPISPAARLVVLSIILLAALGVTLSGCWIYLMRWSAHAARWNLRRVHRVWGISISLVSFMFVLSGGYHLLYTGLRGDSGERWHSRLDEFHHRELLSTPAEAIRGSGVVAVQSISLVKIGGQTYYRIQPAPETTEHKESGHGHHDSHIPHGKATPGQVATPQPAVFVSARDGSIMADGGRRHAIEIAQRVVAGNAIGDSTMVTEFDSEYGFAFKRLPVQRVPFSNGVNVFVDPADGAVAAVIDNADRTEGWIFGYIHKLDWLVPFTGTDMRDAIAMTLAILLAGVALLGLTLNWREQSKPNAASRRLQNQ